MDELAKRICQILKKWRHCICGPRPPYCIVVTDLLNLMLEKCEEEVAEIEADRVPPPERTNSIRRGK